MNTPHDEFAIEVAVNGKSFVIDGMLVMSEMMLGNIEDNNPKQVIDVMKRCLPSEDMGVLSDAQILAIGMRVIYRLRKLGKEVAP